MPISAIIRQTSSGLIVGLGAVIYALSYGALLFSGPLAPLVGYGITIALITAAFGALFGWIAEEKTFISGPDSNTISVQASMFAAMATAGISITLDFAVTVVVLTSAMATVVFLVIGRGPLATVARYIPFSVTAGFLASGGWLMASGGLNIIAGTPLTIEGFKTFMSDPARPDLLVGLMVTLALFVGARRVASAVLIPVVMLITTLGVAAFLSSGLCTGPHCAVDVWRFSNGHQLQWLAPWELQLDMDDLNHIVQSLPGMLVVTMVGVLSILLTIASLELNYQKEFDLNHVFRAHVLTSGLAAAVGGYVGIVSMSRTILNKETSGGRLSGVIATAMCVATLTGAGASIFVIPKAALGGLVLYLGIVTMKQWLWDLRKITARMEYIQIFMILGLVANYGFMTGFATGLLLSCVLFVITYSRIPLANLATDLSVFSSTVVRPDHEVEVLRAHGDKSFLYRLSGYVFFGSASKIEAVFRALGGSIERVVIDFTTVSGIDSSAIAVFQRILRRYAGTSTQFYFVYGSACERSVRALGSEYDKAFFFASLDYAVESAEEHTLAQLGHAGVHTSCFTFLDTEDDRTVFKAHCEMRDIRAGETLSTEGELSNEVFFIESGGLEVMKTGQGSIPLRLAKLHQGALVGELAFYTGDARSASIIAVVDSSVYVLSRAALIRLRADRPDLATQFDHMVVRKIAVALARTNKLVAMFG